MFPAVTEACYALAYFTGDLSWSFKIPHELLEGLLRLEMHELVHVARQMLCRFTLRVLVDGHRRLFICHEETQMAKSTRVEIEASAEASLDASCQSMSHKYRL
jgi:hypothetical protein